MKKFLKFLLYFVLFVLVVLFTAPFLFKGKIIKIANEQISSSVNAQAGFSDIKLSFFKQFPYLSVSVKDLAVVGIEEFEGDTLLYFESFDLALNVLSAIKMENIEIKKIAILNPVINGIVLTDGKANWDIAKASEETEDVTDTTASEFTTNIALKSFLISHARISYTDYQDKMSADMKDFNFALSGDFSQDYSILKINSDATDLNFVMDGIRYLRNVGLNIKMDIDANLKDMIFVLQDNSFALNDLVLRLNGRFEMPDSADMKFDMDFGTDNTNFKTLLSLVPAVYMSDFADLKAEGTMAVNGKILGNLGEVETPNVTGKLVVNNARFSYPDLPKAVENINIDISYFYDGMQMDNTTLDINKFHLEMAGNPVDMTLNLKTPISDPFINCQLKMDLDLTSITDVIPLENTTMKGYIKSNLDLMGNMSVIEKEKYEEFKAVGTVLIKDFYYNSPDVPKPYQIEIADLEFSPKYLDVEAFKSKMGASDFALSGKVTNFLPYALSNDTIQGNFTFSANKIDLNEFMSESTEETAVAEADTAPLEVIEVPGNIDFTLNSNIQTLYYDKLEIKNLEGIIIVRNSTVELKKVNLNTLDGSMAVSGEYNTQDMKNPSVDFNLQASNIDITKAFVAFDMLGEIAPIASKAVGKISLGMKYNSFLNQQMEPVMSSIAGGGNLSSKQIGIKGSNAFGAIGQQLNSDIFKDIILNDLDLTFEISNGKLIVAPFDTKMGSSSLNIQGEQSFDNTLNYMLTIIAPKSVFGSSNSAVNSLYSKAAIPGLDLNAMENINLLVNVTGDMKNPKIKIDPKATTKSLTESVKSEVKANAQQMIDTQKEDAKVKARAEADKLLADAEKQAAEIRKQGKIAADKVRAEAKINADKVLKEAKNPVAKKAAEVSAEKITKEGEKKAKLIETESDTKAQKVLDEAQKQADQLLK